MALQIKLANEGMKYKNIQVSRYYKIQKNTLMRYCIM